MSFRRIVQIICLACLLGAASAYAGPANRNNRGQMPEVVHLTGSGAPLSAVAQDPNDRRIFAAGQFNFKEIETLPQIGPVFNGVSCAGCHSQPAIGGAGLFVNVIRVRDNTQPGPVHIFAADNMLRQGPQSQGGTPIFTSGIVAEPTRAAIPECPSSSNIHSSGHLNPQLPGVRPQRRGLRPDRLILLLPGAGDPGIDRRACHRRSFLASRPVRARRCGTNIA